MPMLNQMGVSKKKIGETFGVSETLIWKIFVAQGWGGTSDKAKGQAAAKELRKRDIKHIVDSYVSGAENITSLSDYYGFKSRGPIKRILVENGISIEKKKEFSHFQQRRIVRSYKKGDTPQAIADEFGVDREVIMRVLKERKVKIRDQVEAGRLVSAQLWKTKSQEEIEEYFRFRRLARKLTEHIYKAFKEHINPKDLTRGSSDFALDHRHSIWEAGFNPKKLYRSINIWEVCHPANLEMLTPSENSRKGKKSSLTRSELRKRIRQWNKEFSEPYFQLDGHILDIIEREYGIFKSFGELGCSDIRGYYKTVNGF